MTNKRFPNDCPRDCPYLRVWDMSVDDLTCVCDLLNAQIDLCDSDFKFMYCPLPEEEGAEHENERAND